jgi:signal transduction histidine kinase
MDIHTTEHINKVLIVDDNPKNLQVLGQLLKNMNFYIEFATNGTSALEWLEHAKFDIVLLDINMPGMNGFEVCRKIRSNNELKNMAVIFLTADNDRESILKGFELGAQDYITKPFDKRELLVRIKTHLSLKRSIESLEDLNQTLEQKVEERTRALIHAKEKAEENDQLKTAFLQNLSHEIRTPMNGILGFAQLLKDRVINPDTFADYVEIIVKSGERMMSIINDLVEISKIEAGQLSIKNGEFLINELLDELSVNYSKLAAEKGLEFQTITTSPTAALNSDRDVIHLIMSNLIKNAIKFTPSGLVTIGCECINNTNRLFVQDTGIGIAPEKKEIIFDRFVQGDSSISRGYEGAGLGLAIAKAYVEAIGGSIQLESELGKGSLFSFTLPECSTIVESSNYLEPELPTPNIQNGLSVLIVEDDFSSRVLLNEYLAEFNARVQYATNGQSAIEIVKKNPDIDLILMDIKMPQMDGFEATKKIRSLGFNKPIIAQTAYFTREDVDIAGKSGVSELIAKPIDRKILLEILGRIL